MPIVGYTCPIGGEEPGRQNDPSHCFSGCKKPCVEPPLLAAMWKADTGNYHQGSYISASMLAGSACPRQTWFERREPFYDLPLRRYWSFRGTHAHSIIEGAADMLEQYGWFQELTLKTELHYDLAAPCFDEHGIFTGDFDSSKDLVVTVKGTTDAYNIYQKKLVDFKTMDHNKVTGFITGINPKKAQWKKDLEPEHLQESWIVQTNIYRWLLARSEMPQNILDKLKENTEQRGMPKIKGKHYPAPTKLSIQAIEPMEIPHSGMMYPYRSGRQVSTFEIPSVPTMTLQETEDFVRPRALAWYKWLVLGKKPPIRKEENAWVCKSCPFHNNICFPKEEARGEA